MYVFLIARTDYYSDYPQVATLPTYYVVQLAGDSRRRRMDRGGRLGGSSRSPGHANPLSKWPVL